MQYTLRNIPREVDRALRLRAKREGKSLNQVAVEALAHGAGVSKEPVRRRDLTHIAGSWAEDPEFDAALRDQDRVDPELWK